MYSGGVGDTHKRGILHMSTCVHICWQHSGHRDTLGVIAGLASTLLLGRLIGDPSFLHFHFLYYAVVGLGVVTFGYLAVLAVGDMGVVGPLRPGVGSQGFRRHGRAALWLVEYILAGAS